MKSFLYLMILGSLSCMTSVAFGLDTALGNYRAYLESLQEMEESLLAFETPGLEDITRGGCKEPLLDCMETLKCLRRLKRSITEDFELIRECLIQKFPCQNPCTDELTVQTIDSATTITAPGVYCLVNDINGTIDIEASNVVLELNNCRIIADNIGVNVVGTDAGNPFRDIVVRNGIIRSALQNGINALFAENILVEDVNFENNATASTFTNCRGMLIDNCSVQGSTEGGFLFVGSSEGKITCCRLFNNNFSFDGITIIPFQDTPSTNLLFKNVTVSNNLTLQAAYRVLGSSNVIFDTCQANNNAHFGVGPAGFVFETGASDSTCLNCQANQNIGVGASGFRINGGLEGAETRKIIWDACIAMNNAADGFQILGSWTASEARILNCCVLRCLAKQNTNNGFLLVSIDGDESLGEFGVQNSYFSRNIAINNSPTNVLGFGYQQIGGFCNAGAPPCAGNVFFSNYGEGNGSTSLNNYNKTAGIEDIQPTLRYDVADGEFQDPRMSCTTVDPTEWHNIAVEPCP